MKKIVAFFVALFILFGMHSARVHAESYTDDMDSVNQDASRSYVNLRTMDIGSASALPDKTVLSFEDASQSQGRAVYTVSSAKSLTVGIYTDAGTFVSRMENGNAYALGFYTVSGNLSARPQGSVRALYSPSRKSVYTLEGNRLQSVVSNSCYMFRDSSETVPDDLIDYGVNVYESEDGKTYRKVNLTPGTVQFIAGMGYCYEEFMGMISPGTKQVIVEINDFSQYYDIISQKTMVKQQRRMTSLASVVFEGEGLRTGPIPEAPASSSSSQSSIQSASSSSSKAPSSDSRDSSSPASSNISSSSSKFEGVITSGSSNSSSRKEESSQSQSSRQTESAQSQKEDLPSEIEHQEKEKDDSGEEKSSQEYEASFQADSASAIVYEVKSKDGPDAFTVGIIIYIVITCLVILYILTRSTKK